MGASSHRQSSCLDERVCYFDVLGPNDPLKFDFFTGGLFINPRRPLVHPGSSTSYLTRLQGTLGCFHANTARKTSPKAGKEHPSAGTKRRFHPNIQTRRTCRWRGQGARATPGRPESRVDPDCLCIPALGCCIQATDTARGRARAPPRPKGSARCAGPGAPRAGAAPRPWRRSRRPTCGCLGARRGEHSGAAFDRTFVRFLISVR